MLARSEEPAVVVLDHVPAKTIERTLDPGPREGDDGARGDGAGVVSRLQQRAVAAETPFPGVNLIALDGAIEYSIHGHNSSICPAAFGAFFCAQTWSYPGEPRFGRVSCDQPHHRACGFSDGRVKLLRNSPSSYQRRSSRK